MNFTDRKIEIAIFGLAILMVGGVGYLLKTPVQTVLSGGDIVYEMPRPKSSLLASLFNLGDREIDRKYVNPFKKKAAANSKKAPETPKAAAASAAKPGVKAVAKKSDDVKRPKVDVQVVGADDSKTWADDGFMAAGAYGAGYAAAPAGATPPTESENTNDKKKETLTSEQWRALLTSQPTNENMNKFLSAYGKGEVAPEDFYQVVTELMASGRPDTQALGLMAVKFVYHPKSFTLTAQYHDQLLPEIQTQAFDYMLSYGVNARLPMLVAVLKGSDVAAISAAIHVMLEGHEAAKSQTPVTPHDPRIWRGDITTNSLTGYEQFIPVLQQLSSSSDVTIANEANSALSQLQSSVAAL